MKIFLKKLVNDEYNMTYCKYSDNSYDKEDSNSYKISHAKVVEIVLFVITRPKLNIVYFLTHF